MKNLREILQYKKVLIFDLDGTIVKLNVNWKHLKTLLAKEFLKIYGEEHYFKTITECIDKIVAREDESELKKFFQIIQHYELNNIKNNEIIEDTTYFINNLEVFGIKKQVYLAILSLNMRETIKQSLKLADIYNKFHYIVGRENVRRWKPHPEGILKIKEHFKVTNEEMIYFGDLKKDIETGMNAGIDAFLIHELIAFIKEKSNKINYF